jgi:hypothetical protein
MQKEISIYFDEPKSFEPTNTKALGGIVGLYFIFTKITFIEYPFDKSKLIYIGMSEKKTNSIASRLSGHFEGKSKNIGLVNYRKREPLFFTYLNFEILKNIWEFRIEDLESYFILDFVEKYGVYPICNNKTGAEIHSSELKVNLKIDWDYFKNKLL